MKNTQLPLTTALKNMTATKQVLIGVIVSAVLAHLLVTTIAAAVTSSPGMLTMGLDAAATIAICCAALLLGLKVKAVWAVSIGVAILLGSYVVSLLLRMPPQEGWTWIVRAAKPVVQIIVSWLIFEQYRRWAGGVFAANRPK